MRVLIAGATGVIGTQLVPVLREKGHEVVALSRSAARGAALAGEGVRPVRADALDAAALTEAVERAAPDAVVNLLTAIPDKVDPRKLAKVFALTNRLRTEGTRNLLAAAARAGVAKVVTESIAFGYRPGGAGLAVEADPLWTDGPAQFVPVIGAVADMERQTAAAGGTVLRFGHLYGPGTGYAAGGYFATQTRKRQMPIVGAGSAVFSFLHVKDAAESVAAALDHDGAGVFNVVDDEPAPVATWLPELAAILGARPPMRLPSALVRPLVGGYGVAYMNDLRGADNTLAARELDWKPAHPTWREGLRAELAAG